MSGLVIDPKKCTRCGLCITQCPFNAMAMVDGQVQINAACKMCRMCLRNCPSQAISEQVDAPQPQIDKSQWHDILVYVEHSDGRIHPVTLELIGKAPVSYTHLDVYKRQVHRLRSGQFSQC